LVADLDDVFTREAVEPLIHYEMEMLAPGRPRERPSWPREMLDAESSRYS
jgi:hypothetical protein